MKLNMIRINKRFQKAIINIKAYNKYGEIASGSAVVIKSKNIAITNYHIIKGSSNFELYDNNQKITYKRIINMSKDLDLVIIQLNDTVNFPDLKTSVHTKVGEEVYAIGFPLSHGRNITEGRINGNINRVNTIEYPFRFFREKLLIVSPSISHGNSGGALINAKGELIGITRATDPSGQNINYAIPIEEALILLKKAPKKSIYKNEKIERELYRYHSTLINGDINQALVHIDNCLNIKSDEEYFLLNKLTLLINLNRYSDAIEACNKILSTKPKYSEVSYLKYMALYLQLRFKEALQVLEDSIFEVDKYTLSVQKGNIYLLMTEYKKAYKCFEKAIALDSEDPLAFFGLAEYYAHTNQLYKAGRIAYKIYNEHPELLIISYLLGEIYLVAGKFDKSLMYFEEFIKKYEGELNSKLEINNIDPEVFLNSLLISNARTLRLVNMITPQRVDEALEEVNYLIERYPNNSLNYSTRAHIRAVQSDFDESVKDLNIAIKINPNNSGAHYLLGMVHFYQANYKKSLDSINRALKCMPHSIIFLTRKAYTLICLENYTEAIDISKQISKIASNAPEANEILFVLFGEKKNHKGIDVISKRLVKTKPNDYYYLSIHANALCLVKKSKEALKFINKSLSIKESILGLVIKCFILFELKQYHETIELFDYTKDKYKHIQPILEGQLWFVKGNTEMKLKMKGTAQLSLEHSFFIYPDLEKYVRPLLKKLSPR